MRRSVPQFCSWLRKVREVVSSSVGVGVEAMAPSVSLCPRLLNTPDMGRCKVRRQSPVRMSEAGPFAWFGGEPGQVGNEAATAVRNQCRSQARLSFSPCRAAYELSRLGAQVAPPFIRYADWPGSRGAGTDPCAVVRPAAP